MGKRKTQYSVGAPAETASGNGKEKKGATSPKSFSLETRKTSKVQKIKPNMSPSAIKKVKSPPLTPNSSSHYDKIHPSSNNDWSPPAKEKNVHNSPAKVNISSIPSPIKSPQEKSPSKKSSFLTSIEDQSTNQVEVFVHRFRAPNCIPRAIIRLSATPYVPGLLTYVAISREGGAIELMSVDEHSKCVGIVEGSKDRHVDALTWICGSGLSTKMDRTQMTEDHTTAFLTSRRLFGASRDGLIFEVDFYTKSLCHVIGSGGGAVFCLTSLCPCCESLGGICQRLIAAGCEDGSIRIYKAGIKEEDSFGNNGGLNLVKILPSAGAAILSIAWLNKSSVAGGSDTLYAGLADGTIRKFESSFNAKCARSLDITTAAIKDVDHDQNERDVNEYSTSVLWTSTLRITVENCGRSIPTKVWALKALDDHTIVSGDSLGHVQFWDGKVGTLIQSFDHSKTDVLDIAVSQDQTKVMAAGIDPTIVCISKDTASTEPGSVRKWMITSVTRKHSHDVHSLVTVHQADPTGCAGMSPTNSCKSINIRELLYSGGADTKICSHFVGDMRKCRPRIVYKYPPVQNISLARIPRIFTIMRSDRIDFYKVAEKAMKPKNMTDSKVLNDMDSSIGSVLISSNHNLSCCDISDDGKILAVGNAVGLALFSIEYPMEPGAILKPHKFCEFTNFFCSKIKFIPGFYQRFACCMNHGDIRIIKVDVVIGEKNDTHFSAHEESVLVEHKGIVLWSHLSVSADGRWLAAASYTTRSGIVDIYQVTDGCKHWWTLPFTETPISCMKFLGGNKSCPVLFVGCNNYAFYIYDVERQSLSDFSQDLGFPVSPLLPIELNYRMECPHFVTQNPSKFNQFFMGSSGSFCAVDLDSPIPTHCPAFPSNHIIAKKLRNQDFSDTVKTSANDREKRRNNFTLCLKYSGILFMEFVDEDEILIVEQPWMSVLNALPDVLQRKRYGE